MCTSEPAHNFCRISMFFYLDSCGPVYRGIAATGVHNGKVAVSREEVSVSPLNWNFHVAWSGLIISRIVYLGMGSSDENRRYTEM